MDYDQLTEEVFSIIKEDDSYKVAKQLQLKNWCHAFLPLFSICGGGIRLPFFLDVLSDEECWEKADTIHGIRLKRRIVAEKMVEAENWKGKSNPLEDFYRYQIACWCCLEKDIVALFEHFKSENEIKADDTDAMKKLVKSASGGLTTDTMMEYWSHVVSGYASELNLENKHSYTHGLHRALQARRGYVEAVEFFWSKIKSLPEDELSAQQKDEIFMNTAVNAAGTRFYYPEIFEFCFSQISPDKYPELLRRDLTENGCYSSLNTLQNALRFDLFQKLFDCLKPSDVSEIGYHTLLKFIEVEKYSEYYADAGAKLFMHMWMREGFDSHRAWVLRRDATEFRIQGSLLMPLIRTNHMEPVWAVLDKASPDQIKEFMNSKQANDIRSVLKEKRDEDSLNKFLSYSTSSVQEPDGGN